MANAIERWSRNSDFRMASHQATFLPSCPVVSKNVPQAPLAACSSRLIEAVEAIAAKESRATSAVLNILVAEALAARAATTVPADAA